MLLPKTLSAPKARSVCYFFTCSFALHLLWENAQAPLFAGFTDNVGQHLWACFQATATGDMAFSLVLYFAISVVHRDIWWAEDRENYHHAATWALPPLIGVLLATAFELWAVYVVKRWEYGLMPIVPVVRVGVTPLLQMIVVPTVTLCLCRRQFFYRTFRKRR